MDILTTVAPYHALLTFEQVSITAWGVFALLAYFSVSVAVLWRSCSKMARSVDRIAQDFSPSVIAADPFLGESWDNYWRTFLRESGKPRKTCEDAENYFNAQTLIDPHLNLRYWQAVPATLVGMGILGTFVGLTFGISAFDVDSVAKIRQSIAALLAGMSTAFVTSLWGMLLSILFGWFEKGQVNGIAVRIQRLCSSMNREFKMTRLDELRLARDYQKETLEPLFLVASDQGGHKTPGNILSELLQESIEHKHKLESLVRVVRFTSASFSSNFHAITVQVEALAKTLSNFSGQFHEVVAQLHLPVDETKSRRHGPAAIFEQASARLLEEVRQVISLQKQAMDNLAAKVDEQALASYSLVRETSKVSVEQIEALTRCFHDNLAGILDRQEQHARTVEDLIAQSKSLVDQGKELTQGVDSTLGRVTSVLQSMGAVSVQILQSSDRLKTGSDTLHTASRHLERYGDRMLHLNQSTFANLEMLLSRAEQLASDYVHQFESIRAGLNGIFAQMQEGLSDYQKSTRTSLNEYLGQFADQLARAVQSLSGGIEELNEVFGEIADAKVRLN